jgi:hypothetical protein
MFAREDTLPRMKSRHWGETRFVRLLGVAPCIFLAAVGCKSRGLGTGANATCALDDDPPGAISAEHVVRDSITVSKGGSWCPALFPTHVALTGKELEIVGAKNNIIAERSDLPAHDLKRIDALYTRLFEFRSVWKRVHSGAEFPGQIQLDFDPKLEAARGMSVLGTAAFAGMPSTKVNAGSAAFEANVVNPDDPTPKGTLSVLTTTTGLTLELEGPVSCRIGHRSRSGVAAADLAATIATICEGETTCVDTVSISARDDELMEEVVDDVSRILSAPPFAITKPKIALSPDGGTSQTSIPCDAGTPSTDFWDTLRNGDAGTHRTKSPTLRDGAVQVTGHLPIEVIQRVVRQNFGRFRICYEAGLATNPNLQGRVMTKFVVDRSGAVTAAQDGGSDLPNQSVVQCVVRAFSDLSFPQPEGGIVTVVYPLVFFPSN